MPPLRERTSGRRGYLYSLLLLPAAENSPGRGRFDSRGVLLFHTGVLFSAGPLKIYIKSQKSENLKNRLETEFRKIINKMFHKGLNSITFDYAAI